MKKLIEYKKKLLRNALKIINTSQELTQNLE